jgi:hypothetical protein
MNSQPTPDIDSLRRAYALSQDAKPGRSTEEWWAIRDAAYVEFDRAIDLIRAEAVGGSKLRVIDSVEELETLQRVVVHSAADTVANIVDGRAYFFGYEHSVAAATLALPVTVLFDPAVVSGD